MAAPSIEGRSMAGLRSDFEDDLAHFTGLLEWMGAVTLLMGAVLVIVLALAWWPR